MAIEQTSAISALTKVTNRDPKELTAPVRDKKFRQKRLSAKVHFRRVNFRSSCLRQVKTTLILHGWQKSNRP